MATIMIIDDDAFELTVHVDALKESGHTVLFLDSIGKALDTLRDSSMNIDLAIVDIMMPTENLFSPLEAEDGKLTGVRLLEKIVEIQPSILLAAITVRKDLKLLELVSSMPIKGLIHKPCMPDDFVAQVESMIGARESKHV